jgi:glutamate/aspartate transport system permease protein
MDFSGVIPAIPGMWNGMIMTLQLMVMGIVGGIIIGTVLALMRLSSNKLLSRIAGAYVNYFRSIPLLLVITWFYLAVPFVLRWITGEDTPVGAFTSCVVAFMMFEAAYYRRSSAPVFSRCRAGRCQRGVQALGMTYGQTMRLIVLPQAFRNMVPLLLTQGIILFQDTSLVYVISLADFFRTATNIGDRDGTNVEMVLFAGACVLRDLLVASLLVKRLQKKVASMISIKNVSKWYGQFQVLTDCTTERQKG